MKLIFKCIFTWRINKKKKKTKKSKLLQFCSAGTLASINTVSQSALSIFQNIQPRLALKRNSRGTPSLKAYDKNPKVAKKSKISQKRTLEEETATIFVSKIGLHGTKLNQMTIMTILGTFQLNRI